MRLVRVFPRKTKATPVDELSYYGPPADRKWWRRECFGMAWAEDYGP